MNLEIFATVVIASTPLLILAFYITNSRISYTERDIDDIKKDVRELERKEWKKIERSHLQEMATILSDRIRDLERKVGRLKGSEEK